MFYGLLLLCIILFIVRNLNNGNLGEKSVYVYLTGVPCPLKVTLQCSVDKKLWEPVIQRTQVVPNHWSKEHKYQLWDLWNTASWSVISTFGKLLTTRHLSWVFIFCHSDDNQQQAKLWFVLAAEPVEINTLACSVFLKDSTCRGLYDNSLYQCELINHTLIWDVKHCNRTITDTTHHEKWVTDPFKD